MNLYTQDRTCKEKKTKKREKWNCYKPKSEKHWDGGEDL